MNLLKFHSYDNLIHLTKIKNFLYLMYFQNLYDHFKIKNKIITNLYALLFLYIFLLNNYLNFFQILFIVFIKFRIQ